MQLPSQKVMLAAGAGAGLLLLLLLVGGWLLWRRRKRRASKYGFKPQPDTVSDSQTLGLEGRDSTSSEADDYVRKRGRLIADVLLDYAGVKGLGEAAFFARLGPEAVVWWVGERWPTSNKGIVAAVHAGPRPGKGFRAKVVVLKAAEDAGTLAAALKKAAKPRDTPVMHDSWGRPIAFEGFPLPRGSGQIVVLASAGVPAERKTA